MRDFDDRATGSLRMVIDGKHDLRRLIIALAALTCIVCAIVFEAWLFLLPSILFFCADMLLRHRLRPPADADRHFTAIPVADQPHAPISTGIPRHGSPHRSWTQMEHVIDQILRRHPHSPQARLVKASMLWYFNGDRDGARCHCREILGRMRREDPLFEKVCDLYMHTYAAASSRPMPLTRHPAADGGLSALPAVPGLKQAKIIPFASKCPPQATLQ